MSEEWRAVTLVVDEKGWLIIELPCLKLNALFQSASLAIIVVQLLGFLQGLKSQKVEF